MRYRKLMAAVVALLSVILAFSKGESGMDPSVTRAATVAPKIVPNGVWGGSGIRIDVRKKGARVEFDCAHGTIPGTLKTDGNGGFDFKGLIEMERGGPVHEGRQAQRRTARYAGRVEGATMALTVTLLDAGEAIGTFTLVRGKRARLTKCM